jgi:hypothetical protein
VNHLNLNFTDISNQSIDHLKRLHSLKSLSVQWNAKKIAPAGAKAIREALPKTRVTF